MDKLLLLVKKDSVKPEITYAITEEEERKFYYLNKDLDDIILVELVRLDFQKDDIEIGRLDNLQTLLYKGFKLWLEETNFHYRIKVTFCSSFRGNSICDISVLKKEKVSKVFKDAEIWAKELIEQFESDKENSL